MWTLNDFRPIYQEFLDRGTTVRQFCQEAGFPESRFYHWQAKLRQEVAAGQTGEFMPVSINNRGDKVVLVDKNHPSQRRNAIQQPVCEICFPNGVTVRLSGSISMEAISGLIMLPRYLKNYKPLRWYPIARYKRYPFARRDRYLFERYRWCPSRARDTYSNEQKNRISKVANSGCRKE